MKPIIYCKNEEHGKLNFYLQANGEEHYLFSRHYCRLASDYYSKGVSVDKALSRTSSRLLNEISDKLPSILRYIEKEYDVSVLKSTFKKSNDGKRKSIRISKLREMDERESWAA